MTLLLIVTLAAFLLLAFKKPLAAAGLILALAPAYLIRIKVLGLPSTLLELLLICFLAAVVLTSPRDQYRICWHKVRPVAWLVALFALAGIIAAAVSPEKAKALGELKAFILEPILFGFGLLLIVNDQAKVHQLLRWLFGGAVAVALFGLQQYFTGFLLPVRFWGYGLEPRRIASVFEYPNALALYLAPLAVLFLHYLLAKRSSLLAWTGLGAIIIALGLTFSRGGWLGFLGGGLVILAKRFSLKKTLAGLLFAAVLVLVIPVTRGRLFTAFRDPSSSAHSQLIKAGLSKIKSSPLLGNGLYGFRTTLARSNFQGEILNYPHNIVLNFWLETGMLGLLSFTAISLYVVWGAVKKPTGYRWAAVGFLVALWLHGLVDVPYFKNDLSLLFWAIIALTLV